jgi:hypothetical protein
MSSKQLHARIKIMVHLPIGRELVELGPLWKNEDRESGLE